MKRSTQGLSLIELMVALAIGSLLIVGAVFVYSQSRNTHTVTDSIARLQENARFAMSAIEADVMLAGYYGFTNSPDDFKFIQGGSTASPIPSSLMQQSKPALAGLPSSAQACGTNFAVDLIAAVQGSNNAYTRPCAAAGGGASPTADTLTIRRASTAPAAATAGRLQLLVSRLSPTNQFVLADGVLPASPALQPDTVEVRDLLVRTYYISRNSTGRPGVPALRVKALTNGPAFAASGDQEILPGVEDLQVQFGIDTGDYDGDGVIDPGLDQNGDGIPDAPNGIATRYVNPNAVPAGFQVVAVRIWLMVRADQPEQGFTDNHRYQYADRDITPNDGFRRMLISKTIRVRNARTL